MVNLGQVVGEEAFPGYQDRIVKPDQVDEAIGLVEFVSLFFDHFEVKDVVVHLGVTAMVAPLPHLGKIHPWHRKWMDAVRAFLMQDLHFEVGPVVLGIELVDLFRYDPIGFWKYDGEQFAEILDHPGIDGPGDSNQTFEVPKWAKLVTGIMPAQAPNDTPSAQVRLFVSTAKMNNGQGFVVEWGQPPHEVVVVISHQFVGVGIVHEAKISFGRTLYERQNGLGLTPGSDSGDEVGHMMPGFRGKFPGRNTMNNKRHKHGEWVYGG